MRERKLFIGANWKMNVRPPALTAYHSTSTADVVVFPGFLDIGPCIDAKLATGAQYGHAEDKGAFTGDVSMQQLKSLGCSHVLCGHSERRKYHHEKNADVAAQVQSALKNGLIPVVCMGETEEERTAGKTEAAIKENIDAIFKNVSPSANVIVAYEPVWAIGTGKTPTPEEAQKTHAFIRSLLPNEHTRIVYGGSANGSNARDFFAQPDIDGALVGGASLKPDDFAAIVESANLKKS